jgi:16S rRNA (guanine527-N7)-methyltransferase
MNSDSACIDELEKYGFRASDALCAQIRNYIELLARWNETLSLTTVTDPAEILRFHFGESIFALTSGLIQNGRLADVGSGGGFPGLPIYLARPSMSVTLVESNMRKCVFLREVARKLGVERGVRVWQGRMETFEAVESSRFDYVTARAVGDFVGILAFARTNLALGGRVVLWVGEEDAQKIPMDYASGWKWSEPVRIPQSERRYLLSGDMA